jgi:hypothetical protein
MKQLIYQVYTGKQSNLYDHCTASVKSYAVSIGADYYCQHAPILRIRPCPFTSNRSKESYEKYGGFLPIYEKENALGYLDDYDQVCVIDADIWIRPGSPSVFEAAGTDVDFAGVIERDMPITEAYIAKLANYSRMQYAMQPLADMFDWNSPAGANFYNMGLMVMNKSIKKYLKGQTPRQFLERREFKPFIDGQNAWKWSTDQTLLNYWVKNEKMSVENLSFKWNGLFTAVDMDRITECHFVHFFLKDKLPNGGENVKELMKYV